MDAKQRVRIIEQIKEESFKRQQLEQQLADELEKLQANLK